MSETTLLRTFMWRASQDLPDVRLFRRNVGKIRIEDRVFVAGIKGQCDIQAVLNGGRIIEIETKSKGGTLRPEQKVWRDWCIAWCVPWMQLKPLKGESSEVTVERWVRELESRVEKAFR